MGPGERFEIHKMNKGAYGFGIFFDRFPYDYSINIVLIKWVVRLGFGKSYIDNEEQV